MEAKLSETDIQELLKNPEKWMNDLKEHMGRQLHDEMIRYHQSIEDVQYFHHKMRQLAEEVLAKQNA